jgi:hypothetical protein
MKKPGIFIGIGGTGVITLAHLKKKIRNEYNTQAEMLKENHFLFLDTDHKTIDAIRNNPDFYIDNDHPIPTGEFCNLGDVNPFRLYEEAKTKSDQDSKRLMEWISKGFDLRNEEIQHGAGAERMAGRTAVFKHRDLIAREIQTGVSKLFKYEGLKTEEKFDEKLVEDVKPAIWVFASSNGGTGSSAIMDVLYTIDREYQYSFKSDPYLRLVLFMPEPFKKKNPDNANYPLNAYSTFWEIEAFRKDWSDENENKFKYFSVKTDKPDWANIKKWPVYSYILPVDAETEKGRTVDLDNLFLSTAEMCFYLHFGAAGGNAISKLDNDLRVAKDKRFQVNDEYWTRSVVSGGFKALVKPNDEFKEYLTKRFMYDLFDYGLLGFEFNEIHSDEKSQKLAKEQFANDYILKHLYNNGASDENFEKYNEGEFDAVKLAKENEKSIGFGGDNEESLNNKFNAFLKSIEGIKTNINSNLNDSKHEWSRFSIKEKIQNDVYIAVEERIEKFGIIYTEHLLFQVDDKFLECKISEIESDISSNYVSEKYEAKKKTAAEAIKNKSYSALNKACNDIKDFLRDKTKSEAVKDILNQLCDERTGLLETIRKAPNGTGLVGLQTLCEAKRNNYKTNLHDLAKKFKKTDGDVFTTYLPAVSSFVDTKGESTWNDGHLFEELYGEIVPLDAAPKSKRKANGDLGVPPIRSNSDNKQTTSLETIIKNISKGFVENYFVNLATQGRLDSNRYSLEDFEQKAQEHILAQIDSNTKVKSWMDITLESYFNDEFKLPKEYNAFRDNFINGIQLLYPRNSQETPDAKFLYAGESETFAEKLGYTSANQLHSFLPDNNLSNRLMVFKYEPAHSLRDYKYFETNKTHYELHRADILNGKKGCHIHKDFAMLDIESSIEKIKNTGLDLNNFVKLGYYESYFRLLSEKNNNLFSSIFELAKSSSDELDDLLNGGTPSVNIIREPLLKVESNGSNISISTVGLKMSSKLVIDKINSTSINNVNSLEDFNNLLIKNSLNLTLAIKLISEFLVRFNENTKSELVDFLGINHDEIYKATIQITLREIFIRRVKGLNSDEAISKNMMEILNNMPSNNIFS